MRLQSLISAMLIGVSGAAIAQVAGASIEAKSGPGDSANGLAPTANTSQSAADNGTTLPDNAADSPK